MFDRDTLNDVTETIVYVNLLLAILAIIALYDQRKIREADEDEDANWQDAVERRLRALEDAVAALAAAGGG